MIGCSSSAATARTSTYPAPTLTLPAVLFAAECVSLLNADLPTRPAEMYAKDARGLPVVDRREYAARLAFVAWPWLLLRLQTALDHAAEAFGLRGLHLKESPRIAHYDVGGLFDWHHDAADQWGTPARRVTASIPLAPRDAYAGGELLVQDGDGTGYTASPTVGDATLFPARLLHKVAPVTRGTRSVLVFWGY